VSEERILMPKRLTAENGAKALFRGEFHETEWQECGHCDGAGWDEEYSQNCGACDGTGEIKQKTPVSWTTIKEIYALAVEKLGVNLGEMSKTAKCDCSRKRLWERDQIAYAELACQYPDCDVPHDVDCGVFKKTTPRNARFEE